MLRKTINLLICFTISFACFLFSDQPPSQPIHVELLGEAESIQPGKDFWVAVHFTMEKPWHIYWKNPGFGGMAPTLDWQLPEGFRIEAMEWPWPKLFTLQGTRSYGYEKEAFLLIKISAPLIFEKNKEASIQGKVRWVACSDENCLSGEEELHLRLPVKMELPQVNPATHALFAKAREQLPKKEFSGEIRAKGDLVEWLFACDRPVDTAQFFPEVGEASALLQEGNRITLGGANLKGVMVLYKDGEAVAAYEGDWNPPAESEIAFGELSPPSNQPTHSLGWILCFAFLGGLILNCMPCVLPVISFKILSFVKMANQSRSLILQHGIFFSLGVIFSFWILAFLLVLFQTYGQTVGWGFQLQEPRFVAVLAAILFLFSLSLFGVYEMGAGFASFMGQSGTHFKGLWSSFFSGILATAVATPCTGPFLGTAVGFAATATPWETFLIFTLLGVGMTLPYLILGACPSCLNFMPKPGPWMATFKEFLGFVMLATVLWLLSVFAAETGADALLLLLVAMLFFGFASWIFSKWGAPTVEKKIARWGRLAALTFLFVGGYFVFEATHLQTAAPDLELLSSRWEPFSATRLAELRAKGVPVFVDFTAKWCLICQANHLVLSSNAVEKKLSEQGVVCMRADCTKNKPELVEEMRKFGRNGVPLYLVYDASPGAPPTILPQVLTADLVIKELEKVKK